MPGNVYFDANLSLLKPLYCSFWAGLENMSSYIGATHQMLNQAVQLTYSSRRDTTVNQLMFTTHLEDGMIRYIDSPLLRAIIFGRVIIIDEADKAPEHVVAIFRSLASQGELTLADGRRVRRSRQRDDDVVVHPNFRMILLANRPGYRKYHLDNKKIIFITYLLAFLGNHFLQVLGDNFSW